MVTPNRANLNRLQAVVHGLLSGHSLKSGWIPIVLIALSLLLQGLHLESWVEYDRAAVQQGQWWRLLTCNIIHLGWGHWWLNMAGLVLIWLLFGEFISHLRWLAVLFISSVFVSLGITLFSPEVEWYVGLSGALHGLFLAGLIAQLKHLQYRDVISWLVLIGFLAKLIWEQLMGPLPGSEAAAGGDVLVEAHFYGTVGGAVWVLFMAVLDKYILARHPI